MQLSIQDFSAGLRTDLHQSKIPDGACAACQNALFTKATVKCRPGFVSHSAAPDETPDLSAGITALAQYVPPDGLGQNTRLVAQFGSLLKATDNAAQTFAAHLDMATTLATTAKVRMQQFGDALYLVDGVNNAKKMFNQKMWKYRPSVKIDDIANWGTAATYAPGGIGLGTTYAWIANPNLNAGYTSALVKYNRATAVYQAAYNTAQFNNQPIACIPRESASHVWVLCWLNAVSGGADPGLVRVDLTGVHEVSVEAYYGTGASQLNEPLDFAERTVSGNAPHLYVCDTGNSRISLWDVDAAPGNRFVYTFGTGYLAEPRSICVDGNADSNHVYVLDFVKQQIFKFTFTGTYVAQFGYEILNGLDPLKIRYITEAGLLVVSCRNDGHLYLFTTSGEYKGRLFRRYWRYVNDATYNKALGLAVGGADWEVWSVALPASQVVGGAAYDDNFTVEKYVRFDYYGEEGVGEIKDGTRPVIAPTTATGALSTTPPGADPFITAGTYIFMCTAAYTGGKLTVLESDVSPDSTALVIGAGVVRYIDVTCNVAGLFNQGDAVYLYYKLSSDTTYKLCAHAIYTSGSTVTFRIRQLAFDNATDKGYFINAPYTGASHLIEWQGRMVYANYYVGAPSDSAKDTLHISNLNDPISVPTATYVDPPDNFGTYVQVGADGTPITGLAKIGSYLAVFKRQSVWLLSGTTWRNFELAQASTEHGCISHESIAYVSGRLVFLANDSVWSFDGQQFDDLGKNIRPTIDGYTLTQKEKSFAVYDPNNRWYVLFMPSTAALASVPTGHALVFDLRTGAWTRFTAMPGNTNGTAGPGCAIYAARRNGTDTTFPGVFSGDPYGADETLIKLFRMFTGLTDLGAAIAWNWWGKEHSLPDPSVYKDIRRVRAQIVEGAPATNTFMGNLRTNGSQSSATDQTLALPEGTQVPMMVRWTPVLLADVSSYQVGFSGSSSTAMEIGGMDVTVNPKGPVV